MYQEMIAELTEKKKIYDDLVYITVNESQKRQYERKSELYKNMINLIVAMEMIFIGE